MKINYSAITTFLWTNSEETLRALVEISYTIKPDAPGTVIVDWEAVGIEEAWDIFGPGDEVPIDLDERSAIRSAILMTFRLSAQLPCLNEAIEEQCIRHAEAHA